ncbi:MAG: AzlC family ABC transporter permease [Beijerinckiaceae bacterium]|nr:AzlC family ABC transporter permease [Beijerinckiaceae bacterium]
MPDDSSPALKSPRQAALAGLKAAAGLPSFMLMASLIGVGGLCRDVGYPMGAAVASTILVWAGPAQMVLFGSIAAGVALPLIAVAICVSSIRFVPMCMSILPLMREPAVPARDGQPARKGTPTWLMLILAHFVAVTAWVEGMRRLPAMPKPERIPYFLAFASTVMLAAAFSTGAGYYLIAKLPPALAAGLLFTSPIYFTVALAAGARQSVDWLALVLGFGAAPLVALVVPAGFDLMVGGIGMGTLAYAIHRLQQARRRRAEGA